MNYPVSVWLCVDSSPDKVVHAGLYTTNIECLGLRERLCEMGSWWQKEENYYHF